MEPSLSVGTRMLTFESINLLSMSARCVLACGQKVRDVFDFIVEQSVAQDLDGKVEIRSA